MLDFVREGDSVIVESISRLGRSTRDLPAIVEQLLEKSVEVISMKEPIDITKWRGTRFGRSRAELPEPWAAVYSTTFQSKQ